MSTADEAEVLRLERALAARDPGAVEAGPAALLDDGFCEFGASGRVWDRAATVEMLERQQGSPVELLEASFRWLGADVALLTYRLAGPRPSLRSSIWRRADGRWKIVFHQGTRLG